MTFLTELQRLATSGARAVAAFELGGQPLLAVPQLALDAPGTPEGMNGGSSDTSVLLYREVNGRYVRDGSLPVGGGEDVEVFSIDGRLLLAVASIRSGNGPYEFATSSTIFEATTSKFEELQSIQTYAAKQWRHFAIGDRQFLALAQNHPAEARDSSAIFEWDGRHFRPFQELESAAGYNIAEFELDGVPYLAHADHALPSRLYRWDGQAFAEHQDLLDTGGGRAFQRFDQGGERYLAVARIDGDSLILRWNGSRFEEHAVLPGGLGGREFALIEFPDAKFLIRVNFIHGSPTDPQPDLASYVYQLNSGYAELVEEFRTTGGTDVSIVGGSDSGSVRVAVSNGLAARPVPGATFGADTVIYRFDPSGGT